MTKRTFDRLLNNSRQTTQQRLDMILEKQNEPVLDIDKCLDCEKFTYYGRTCDGHCIREDEKV
jgi:hypothetical protein